MFHKPTQAGEMRDEPREFLRGRPQLTDFLACHQIAK